MQVTCEGLGLGTVEVEVSLEWNLLMEGVTRKVRETVGSFLWEQQSQLLSLSFEGGGIEGQPYCWGGTVQLSNGEESPIEVEMEWWS